MKIAHFALLLVLATFPMLAKADLARIELTVKGISPSSGSLEVSLFNSEETFMNTPLVQQTRAVGDKTEVAFTFSGLLEGDYAIVVVHDENDNKTLDSGFLGFGGESYGFSNNVNPWFGWPSFESASFKVGVENAPIEINLH
jgi:uncharacterized protein (DUF2141 family)